MRPAKHSVSVAAVIIVTCNRQTIELMPKRDRGSDLGSEMKLPVA